MDGCIGQHLGIGLLLYRPNFKPKNLQFDSQFVVLAFAKNIEYWSNFIPLCPIETLSQSMTHTWNVWGYQPSAKLPR